MAGTDSAEYRTLLDLTVDLGLAVRDDLVGLSSALIAARLITRNNGESVRNQMVHQLSDRAAMLVNLVQTRVEQNPQNYQKFIDVLEREKLKYEDILKKLKTTYEKYKGMCT